MKQTFLSLLLFCMCWTAFCQTKKPLNPTVYDGWESIGEHLLSSDGQYLVYTVTPQEGDGRLEVRGINTPYSRTIPRGADASITEDGHFLVFRIKPFYKDSREAKIKKKTPEQSPKDTLAWMELGKDSLIKIPRVRSYKVPEKNGRWLAYLMEKPLPGGDKQEAAPDSATRLRKMLTRADSLGKAADSLLKLADSLRSRVGEIRAKGFPTTSTTSSSALPPSTTPSSKKESHSPAESIEEGTQLVLLDLSSGKELKFPLVSEYNFSRNGQVLVVETTRKNADSLTRPLILWVNTTAGRTDTVMKGFKDARNYALDENGTQLAFVAERDSATRALIKFYRLWYYAPGMDSAVIAADRNLIRTSPGPAGAISLWNPDHLTISPDFQNRFSRDGHRLFLGLSPIRPPKDTTLVDFETARLDVWNYQDDYLAPEQLVQLPNELKRSYLAEIPLPAIPGQSTSGSAPSPSSGSASATPGKSMSTQPGFRLIPLADEDCEIVIPASEGNGNFALGASSRGYRIRQQWEQNNLERLYLIDLRNGSRKLVQERVRGGTALSPGGNYFLWYDWHGKNWFTYEVASGQIRNITSSVTVPLFDELDDHPDDPPPHGLMGWMENDKYVYIYDKYDIWQCDPSGTSRPVNLTRGEGRTRNYTFRYIRLDKDERFLHNGQLTLLGIFDKREMGSGLKLYRLGTPFALDSKIAQVFPRSTSGYLKAKNNWTLAFLSGSFDKPNDLFVIDNIDTVTPSDLARLQTENASQPRQLSHINPQQTSYNWLTVELHRWRMLDGKMSEGLLYKPENFDSTRKYPVIFYFYERDAETRYQYMPPQPVRASINIPYFVSNGYIVFDPDIYYKTGQPGEDAYNSIMSAARYLGRFKWIDTTKMAIQGHSWGGYQVAYLVTRTHLFAAAEAGAPVSNMTSAYGGIRWSTGISRQFQYEKSQSRIGAPLWQHPDLYLKNSPLFRADKVTTPLLMMHNDADGAVPWYQGIEYFSALRRLGKKVWLIQYNGEDHGLMERRNRKDWSIRLSQFFGYYLKGERPAKWITQGVPATLKGIDWGLETE